MLAVLVFSGVKRAKEEALKKQCVNNLKQVGLAFRQWALDGDRYPTQLLGIQGGALEASTNGSMFRNFQVMSNQLRDPKILVCPADNRTPPRSFSGVWGNTNVSYFIGLDAHDTYPQTFLSGDRNLEIDGVAAGPGIVAPTTNNNLSWTRMMHNQSGNVCLADGSVYHFDKQRLNEALAETGAVTNRLVLP